jgi:antitoxin CptB
MAFTLAASSNALPAGAAGFRSGGLAALTSGDARNGLADDGLIDERSLSKLKWRCRRGLLENDLFIERFFKRFETSLTVSQAAALTALMDLSDNDLMDLHLCRKELAGVPDAPQTLEAQEVLSMLRVPGQAGSHAGSFEASR